VSLAPLETWLVEHLPVDVRGWYEKALAAVRRAGVDGDDFANAWSGCGRRLGKSPLAIVDADKPAGLAAALGWGADEAGRAVLLLAALEATPEPSAEAVTELFAKGEMREQQAVLRVLAYLPGPDRYVALAADAVRTNVLPVLEALACDNPYPARHMPDLAFNQMVMKVIFNGLPLGRVANFADRNNPELRRMVEGYASERRAAGRPVPADVDLILGGTSNASV